jgi:hypothetical protein
MPLSPYAESDIDLSWLTDFMALTKCGSFSPPPRRITQPGLQPTNPGVGAMHQSPPFERGRAL